MFLVYLSKEFLQVDWSYKVSEEKLDTLQGVSSFMETQKILEEEPRDSTFKLSDLYANRE